METSDQKRKGQQAGGGGGAAEGGAGGGKARKFQLPPGYETAYLGSGKNLGKGETDFAQLRSSGDIQKSDDADLVKAYAAWLWDEEGLAELVGKHEKPLPAQEKKRALEKLAKLSPFDREALGKFFDSTGVTEKFTRALGPEGLAQLGKGAPPPVEEVKEDSEKPAGEEPPAAEDTGDAKGEHKGRFQGGPLFDKLFKTPLQKKKVDDPQPILSQLQALDERAFDELALTISREQAWEPLLQALGPRFSELVARQRYQPLRRALAQFPDGVCDPGERTRILHQLERLSPFEQRFLQDLVQKEDSGNALANLLGPQLQMWLSGGALIADKKDPDEEPEAALAAARELPGPTQRRLAERLTAGAVGPALLEALGADNELFVRGYWDAVTRPNPEQRQSPKLPLKALAGVNPAQLQLLAWCSERKGQEPASLDAGAGATQFDALLRPLLSGAAPSPEAKKKTLESLRSLSLLELKDLFTQLSSDGTGALEALLGAGFSQLVGERLYQPLKDALEAHPDGDELREADKELWLSRLRDLDPWAQAHLKAYVVEQATGARLAACFGASLKQIGLDELAAPNSRPPPKPRWLPTPPQRKKALEALKKASPTQFASLVRGSRLGALQRFATGAAAGLDEELGRALLKYLPAEMIEEPADPAADEAELRGFFERVVADERARADDPPSAGGQSEAPRKRKKDDEETPLVEEHDVLQLYEKLLQPNLDKAVNVEVALAEFLALPPPVQQALGQHVRTQGSYERFVQRLGLDFARATAENAAPPKESEGDGE